MTQFDYGNGLQTLFSFDTRDRLLSVDTKDGETSYLDLDYAYDDNGNITQVENGWRDTSFDWHSQTESYTYDGLDRLLSASSTAWSHSYSYDKAGNRTAKDGVTYTVNTVNQAISLSDGTSFAYDANGNRTQKTAGSDTWEYTYDFANRLTKVEKNSAVLEEYVYDGNGQRIRVKKNNETTTYIYSGLNVLYKENTTGTAAYIYGPTGRLALRTTIDTESHTFYYHTDHLGSTRVVTDESKTVVTDAVYEPFGETAVTGEEPFLYTGKEKDSTGLSYYNARYYDPETGRFITRDPLAGRKVFPQSLNRYTYCLNNPVKFIDPSGLAVERFCNVDTGTCISISDSDHHWIAYDANGNIITSSREIERLLLVGTPEALARAAYLMLLATHPEIEGDPNAEITPADFMNTEHTTFFEVTVTIEGKDVTLYIGIDDRPFFEGKDGKKYYGDVYEHSDGSVQIVLFRKAFSSLKTLFHVVGHEGQHIVDLVKYEGPILPKDRDDDIDLEEDAYAWNTNNNNKPPYNVPWPWTWPIPYS